MNKKARLLAILLVLGLVVTACSPAESGSSTTEGGGTTTTAGAGPLTCRGR